MKSNRSIIIFVLYYSVSLVNAQIQENSNLPSPENCGSFTPTRISTSGNNAFWRYPWTALIQHTRQNNLTIFHCDGVLINENYVLTTSHCVSGKKFAKSKWQLSGVCFGEWEAKVDYYEEDLCSDPILHIPVAEIIPHEDYQPDSPGKENDIALIRLSRAVRFSDWVKPICLPVASHLRNKNFDGVRLEVANWSKIKNASNSDAETKVTLDSVPLSQCSDAYQALNIIIGSKQLCAGGEEEIKLCRGDSGAPLMTVDRSDPLNQYYYLVGLASFGPSVCSLTGLSSVYTRVDAHLDWIISKIKP